MSFFLVIQRGRKDLILQLIPCHPEWNEGSYVHSQHKILHYVQNDKVGVLTMFRMTKQNFSQTSKLILLNSDDTSYSKLT